jgi:autotransporter-associated beta strand protein
LNSVSTASQVQLGTGTLTVNSFENSSFAGVISETGAVVKQGANTLTLTGANTYTGTTTVSAGVLNIQNSAALGGVGTGTSVTSGAALQLEGGITVGTEALTLNGTGVSNNGALRNISGNNSWAGAVTLGSATRINSDAGTLTMSGNFGGAQNLTVGGAGNTTLSGVLGTGAGTLTKDGAGTLTLSGGAVNTFSGAVTINAGTLDLAKSGALNNAGNNVTVNSGGTLLFSGASTTRMNNAAGVTLAGGTLTAQDVTETVGTLTLTAASVINLGTDAGNDDLTFANLTDTGGSVVIYNWSGTQYSSGTDDRIFVTGAAPGTIFGDITFNGFNAGAIVLASRELVPIPEPGTVLAGVLIAGLIAWRCWQRRRAVGSAL